MSGLLRLASCSAFSPAGAAFRGGPAARSAPGTPSIALLLSGGLHLAALTLFLIAAARSPSDQPLIREIRVLVDPGISIVVPPDLANPMPGGGRIDPRGRIDPVPPREPTTEQPEEPVIARPGTVVSGGPVKPADGGGTAGEWTPPKQALRAGNPDVPTDRYDSPPTPVYAPEPEYPSMPLEAGIEGKVVLEALVGRDGLVREVVVKEGNPMLAESAKKAVLAWRFKAARWQGESVTAWVAIPVVFRIH